MWIDVKKKIHKNYIFLYFFLSNGQSRETGNIGYTKHKTKTNKTKNPTQYVWTALYVSKHK